MPAAYLEADIRDRPEVAGTTGREPAAGSSEADHGNRPALAER